MIPIDALRAVRVVVSHRYPDGACPDGLASAMILKDALPDVDVRSVAHNTAAYDALEPEAGMLFCDISPPAARLSAFVEAGVIVLDHHKDQEANIARFGERGVFAHETRDPGVSGALLAFEHVWKRFAHFVTPSSADVERFARLAGVRDTWQREHPLWDEACRQSAVLLFWPEDDWLGAGLSPLDPTRLRERMGLGGRLIQRGKEETERLLMNVYTFGTERGTRVAILPSVHLSDAADRLLASGDCAVVVGFAFVIDGVDRRPMMRLSFRSRRGAAHPVDVSAIACEYGGGGHTNAAGAALMLDSPDRWLKDLRPGLGTDPYAAIIGIMRRF